MEKEINTEIYGNKDISRLSFTIYNIKNIETFLEIIGSSITIEKFDIDKIDKIKKNVIKNYNSYIASNKINLTLMLERFVFKTNKLQNSFYGNSLSLKLIKPEDMVKYYNEFFTIERLLLFVNGNITKNDFRIEFFDYFENQFNNTNYNNNIQYERVFNRDFDKEPVFFKHNLKDVSFFEFFYRAPSFLNDEYFSYLIALEFFKENFYKNSYIIEKPEISSSMINILNYGSVLFSSKNKDIQSSLLSLKKIIEVSKKQYGYFNFYVDSTTDIIKDYKNQNENKIYNITTSIDLKTLKEKIFQSFNFYEIDTVEKEIKFVTIFFLLGQIIDPFVIKEKIDLVTDKDIIKIFENYFINLSWGIYTNPEMIKNISKDFFYR